MVLKNKLNITNSIELAEVEERLSKKKAQALFDNDLSEQYPTGSYA